MKTTNPKKIAVLYGGISSERDISLISGQNIADALISKGHKVDLIDTKDKSALKNLIVSNYDLAYIALHGKGGEDGSIQGFLESIDLPYTGSKILASAIAMNKATTKTIYDLYEINNADYFVVSSNNQINLNEALKRTGDDVVVKAASQGSSIGLYFAKGLDNIKIAIDKALEIDDSVLIEKRVVGKEYTVAVLDFDDVNKAELQDKLKFYANSAALPVIEIIPKNEFYDFESKYDEGGSQHVCPAKIDEQLKENLQYLAVQAHKALGCKGFSRTDFLVDSNSNAYALETNSIPGMTSKSLVPDAARSIGICFEDLCDMIVEYALS